MVMLTGTVVPKHFLVAHVGPAYCFAVHFLLEHTAAPFSECTLGTLGAVGLCTQIGCLATKSSSLEGSLQSDEPVAVLPTRS